MENNTIFAWFCKYLNNTTISSSKGDLLEMQPKMSCYVIFNLHLAVGHSVLCQMEGVGHVSSNYHILKCSGPPSPPPPPTPVIFDQSLSRMRRHSSPIH